MADKKEKQKSNANVDEKVNKDKQTTTENKSAKADVQPDLNQQVTDLKKQLDEMEDRYLRAQAEVKNIQHRSQQEQADMLKYDGQKLATNVLPVLDNLQRALDVKVDDEAGKQLKSGVEMVTKHLQKALTDSNVQLIKTIGTKFDPKLCQAVQTVPADDDHPADTVVSVLQNGYTLSGRVLRPAMVVVAQ